MPPQSLSLRLQALSDTYKQTLDLIRRLQKLPANPGLTSPDPDPRIELVSEIHQRLKEQEDALEIVRQEVDDSVIESGPVGGRWVGGGSVTRRRDGDREQERERTAATVARLGEDLKAYENADLLGGSMLTYHAERARRSGGPSCKRNEMRTWPNGRSERRCSQTVPRMQKISHQLGEKVKRNLRRTSLL
jgi:hypothetical protein